MASASSSHQPGASASKWGISAAPPRWAVLQVVPHIMEDDDLSRDGPEFSLSVAPPPHLTQMKVRPNFASDGVTDTKKIRLLSTLAADPSGILLIGSTDGKTAAKPVGPYANTLVICDATTNTVLRLPDHPDHDPDCNPLLVPANAGLIVNTEQAADPRKYMVVRLLSLATSGHATMLFYSSHSAAGEWEKRSAKYPVDACPWYNTGVFSYGRNICWVDLSRGFLTCDIFDVTGTSTEPMLEYVELPFGTQLPGVPGGGGLHMRRCITVSDGKITFVVLTPIPGKPTVSVYTMLDLKRSKWECHHQVGFKTIWTSESYKATGLPPPEMDLPVLAFVHPENPNEVYFFVHRHLVGVDLSSIKIKYYVPVSQISNDEASSRFVLPWILPPPLIMTSDPDEDAKLKAFKSIGYRFFSEYHKSLQNPGRALRCAKDYSGERGQTTVCAHRALNDYNFKNGTSYILHEAEDSHAFELHDHDQHFFVHVNFTAKDTSRNGQTHNFFAELKGDNEPEEITVVSVLGPSAEDICVYCTGLQHPTNVAFQGSVNDRR